MSNRSRSLTAGAAALVAAKSLSFALSLSLPLVLVRIFDQRTLGLYKQAFVLVQTIITVLPPGFCMTSFYFFPREPEKAKSVAFNAWLVASLIGLIPCVALFVRPELIHYAVKEAEAVGDARWIGLVIFLWSTSLFIELAPLANRDVNFASKFIVFANLLKSAMMLVGGLITRSLHGVLVASAIFGFFQLGILIYYLHSRFPGFVKAFDWPMLKKQIVYFARITPGNLMGDLQLWMPWYFVGSHYTTVQYAIYAMGCFNIPVTQILVESVGSVLVRRVSELVAINDKREIIRVSLSATRKLSLAFFPFYVMMVVVSREFFQVLMPKYGASVPIFVLNITLVPLSIFVFDPIGRAFPEQQGQVIKIRALGVAVLVAGLWYGTSHYGPISATFAVLAAALVERTGLLLFWGRVLGATKADLGGLKDMGRIAIASIGAGAMTWLIRLSILGMMIKPIFLLIVCGCIFVPVYVVLLVLLNVPTDDERRLVTSRLPWFARDAKLA